MPSPCNQQPMKWVSCCQVVDCLDIKSSDGTIEVLKSDCGIDLKFSGNNLNKVIKLNSGSCVSFIKEYIDGVLNFTPHIDLDCLAPQICNICSPTPTCSAPLFLSVINV